ncbi:MAG: [Oscillospiraceae bacterium]|nr:[FeFe] hydrogenase H-cluster maturation GTPase HydF [Oscillospiraceae bacterium]
VLRDALDAHAVAITTQVEELEALLQSLPKAPKMVITDSQVFGAVGKIVPKEVPLTSFSILMARYRGELAGQICGAALLSRLEEGDKVLIAEACTHRRQCNDIGTVKMPRWIEDFSKAKPAFSFTSGVEFPKDLAPYRLIVHCGGCMVNDAEMRSRGAMAREAGVPMVNYGVAIAHIHGILRRSLELFPRMLQLLDE